MTVTACGHCGQQCQNYQGGWASAFVNDENRYVPGGVTARRLVMLCHPNAAGRRDCYKEITVHGRKLGDLRTTPS